MMNGPRRIALHSEVRDGYEDAHARIPDELISAFSRVGIHEWTIWSSGAHMFHLVVCDDWDAALAGLAHDPANIRWQERIGPFVELYRDGDGAPGFAPLRMTWDLTSQRTNRS
jgi:L-rhamnose mutarotase